MTMLTKLAGSAVVLFAAALGAITIDFVRRGGNDPR